MQKLIPLLCVVLLLTAYPLAVGAQGKSDDILFEADFEDGNIPDEVFSSSEQTTVTRTNVDGVQSRVLEITNEGVNVVTLPDFLDWTDYTFETKLRMSDPIGISFYTRVDTSALCSQGYTLDIFVTGEGIMQAFDDPDECTVESVSEEADFDLPVGEWFTVSITWAGSDFEVALDGETLLTGSDRGTASGTAGIGIFDNGVVEIDYIRVTEAAGGGGALAGNPGGDPNPGNSDTIRNFDGGYQAVVAELENNGVIPSGGRLLFEEDYSFTQAAGSGYYPLSGGSRVTDFVLSFELTLDVSTDDACGMLFRRVSGNEAGFIYMFEDGYLAAGYIGMPGNPAGDFTSVDPSRANTITVVALGDEATIYLNGDLFVTTEVPAMSGSYGLGFLGNSGVSGRCEARNIWVYNLD